MIQWRCQWAIWLIVFALCLGSTSPRGMDNSQRDDSSRKLKGVIFGGHPDDPESGAGGLAVTLAQAGHEVILAYATSFRDGRRFLAGPSRTSGARRLLQPARFCTLLPSSFPTPTRSSNL